MSIFRVPYRWLPRTFWTNIRSCWIDVTHGIHNIIRWTPVIWFDADFDWSYLAVVMEYKLRRMSKVLGEGHHLHRERDAKQTLICAELLRRLQAEDYYENADRRFPIRSKHWAAHISMQEKQDQDYLAMMIRKYLRNWWD
jgi:hypothetical protein